MHRLLLTIPLTLLATAAFAQPATRSRERPELRLERMDLSRAPILRLYVTDIDASKKPILDRPPKNYQLLIDAKPVAITPKIKRFGEINEAVSLTFVIQVSNAMKDVFNEIIESAKRLTGSLPRGSMVGLVAYTDVVVQDIKPNAADKLKRSLDELSIREVAEVRVPDAVRDALDALGTKGLPARRMIVVVSDGLTADLNQAMQQFSELGRRAADKGVALHAIGYAPLEPARLVTLAEMTKRGKGTLRKTKTRTEVTTAFDALSKEILGQLVLDYELKVPLFDGQIHDFQLELGGGSGLATDIRRTQLEKLTAKQVEDDPEKKGFRWLWVIVAVGAFALMGATVLIWKWKLAPPKATGSPFGTQNALDDDDEDDDDEDDDEGDFRYRHDGDDDDDYDYDDDDDDDDFDDDDDDDDFGRGREVKRRRKRGRRAVFGSDARERIDSLFDKEGPGNQDAAYNPAPNPPPGAGMPGAGLPGAGMPGVGGAPGGGLPGASGGFPGANLPPPGNFAGGGAGLPGATGGLPGAGGMPGTGMPGTFPNPQGLPPNPAAGGQAPGAGLPNGNFPGAGLPLPGGRPNQPTPSSDRWAAAPSDVGSKTIPADGSEMIPAMTPPRVGGPGLGAPLGAPAESPLKPPAENPLAAPAPNPDGGFRLPLPDPDEFLSKQRGGAPSPQRGAAAGLNLPAPNAFMADAGGQPSSPSPSPAASPIQSPIQSPATMAVPENTAAQVLNTTNRGALPGAGAPPGLPGAGLPGPGTPGAKMPAPMVQMMDINASGAQPGRLVNRKTAVLSIEEIEEFDFTAWIVRLDRSEFHTYPVRDRFTIGSDPSCDLALAGTNIRPRHGQLRLGMVGFSFDEIAADGRATSQPLSDNSRFRVGDAEFAFKVAARFEQKQVGAARIEILSGMDQGRSLPLQQGVSYVVGSHASCDLVARGDGVGPRHMVALRKDRGCIVSDLGAEAGLVFSGEAIGHHTLKPGEEITIGSVRLVYTLENWSQS